MVSSLFICSFVYLYILKNPRKVFPCGGIAMCLSLRGRCYIIERLQDALVGVVMVTTRGSVLRLVGNQLDKDGERTQILEPLGGQLHTL